MTGKGDDSLEAAQQAARDARTRLSDTVCEIKARLQPSALAEQAKERVRGDLTLLAEKATTTAEERPAAVGLVTSAVALLLLRKPLGRLMGRIFDRNSAGAMNERPDEAELRSS